MAKTGRDLLKKELTLFDVYAISTGAMFSSGFFLLPGIAAAETGPSVVLAYLVAGLFILPTMISVAELSTAMPRAGGAYYFIDRSLGPLFGTIGGFGTWLALVFKSAFALIGMGAYVAIFIDLPILPVAIGLTVVFGFMNIFGAKESSWLQKVLVTVLIVILLFYLVQGLFSVVQVDFFQVLREEFDPFFQFGAQGFFSTIGLVFVSYAGLTKVASAFQLLLFAILNICVIVMRESRIEGYDPGFKSPFYPWMQLAGFFLSAYLIVEMGLLSILFTLTVIAIAVIWYFKYAIHRIEREGAIFHVHARLGEYQYEGLEQELREIVREKGLRKEDQYARVVESALVLDLSDVRGFGHVVALVAGKFSEKLNVPEAMLLERLLESGEKALPAGKAAAIKHLKLE